MYLFKALVTRLKIDFSKILDFLELNYVNLFSPTQIRPNYRVLNPLYKLTLFTRYCLTSGVNSDIMLKALS